MPARKILIDKHGRTGVKIPSFLRDKFDMKNGDYIDIDTDGENIILKPIKKA